MAEGNKPLELHISESVIKVNSWQDVFIQFLKYQKDYSEFSFTFILGNQYELFGRDTTIVKWSTLKDLIDKNEDLSTRYKTFDGKTWKKVKELNDELLFIHINISALTCVTRIANVMEKLDIPKNSIEIRLK